MNSQKIGLYLCQCGGEISQRIDVDRVAHTFGDIEVKIFPMLCTPEALDSLSQDISRYDRVIFAACTPQRIEKTLRNAAKRAGLNPYLIQIVNLREQCAWVSDENPTDKAISLIKGALERLKHQEELEEKYIDVSPDVAVIGGGISGVMAALNLSDDTRKVYLIEKSPFIGGETVTYEELTPDMECAHCFLAQPLQDVLERDNTILLTNAEVVGVRGSPGNFWLKIEQEPRFVDVNKCIGCNECLKVCPVEIPSEYEFGMKDRGAIFFPYTSILPNAPFIDNKNCYQNCQKCVEECIFDAIDLNEKEKVLEIGCGAIVLATGSSTFPQSNSISKNIFTSPQFERLLANDGPTQGKVTVNGEPQKVAIIHCVGREELGYCSQICCSVALKYSHMIHRQLPHCEVHHIYYDLVLPPSHQKLYEEAEFAHFHKIESGINVRDQDGKIIIDYGENDSLETDMVVLMSGITPSQDIDKLADLFNLDQDKFGFIETEKILPVQASSGVMAAGSVMGPCSVEEAIKQALAASGRVLSTLQHGEKLLLNVESCFIDEQKCSACAMCVNVCPYGAISLQNGTYKIDETFCNGCGICASTCPVKAIKAKHYTSDQINAEIEGLLK